MQNQGGPAPRGWERLSRLWVSLLVTFFTYRPGQSARMIRAGWLAALYLFGAVLWGIFFSRGEIAFDFLDWAEVTGPRYALLQDALRQGVLPLHAANTSALRGVTDRYFSIVDTPFSPQIILLRTLDMGQYIFVDTLLFYTLGFLGLALLARKYRLAPLSFFALFILIMFNGHITAHFAVGHSIWTGYLLIPFYVYLVLDVLERGQAGWGWVLGLSVLLLVILLQGYFHLYLWCLLFLGMLLLLNFRLWKPIMLGGLFSVLLGLPRLLPPALALSGLKHEYLGGFTTATDLIFNMFMMRDPDRAMQLPSEIMPLGWWEQDFFVGLIGFAMLVVFGIIIPLANSRGRKLAHRQVLLTCFIFAALSVGQVYGWIIRVLPIPPLTAERVTTRMFSLPLVFLIVLATVFFQRWLEERSAEERGFSGWVQGIFLGLALLLFHDLYQHLQAWRVRYLDGLVYLFPKVPFDPSQHTIANHPDPVYTSLLIGGSVAALLALGFMAWMALRERAARRKAAGPNS